MSNQEVFNALAELEQYFFYKKNNPGELSAFWPQLIEMHEEVKTLLCQWHNLTGCENP